MNIEQGISNDEVEKQMAFTSKFIILYSLFDNQISKSSQPSRENESNNLVHKAGKFY